MFTFHGTSNPLPPPPPLTLLLPPPPLPTIPSSQNIVCRTQRVTNPLSYGDIESIDLLRNKLAHFESVSLDMAATTTTACVIISKARDDLPQHAVSAARSLVAHAFLQAEHDQL